MFSNTIIILITIFITFIIFYYGFSIKHIEKFENPPIQTPIENNKIIKINSIDQKAVEYEENLQKQEKLSQAIQKKEDAQQNEFQKQYLEANKINTEIGTLKKTIQELQSKITTLEKQPLQKEPEYKVGCNSNSDCNLFYGDGKNTCNVNKTCRCEIGSGNLCHLGPTNYKDTKDMTDKEKTIFKNTSNYDNFTIQDYKNWLLLYENDYFNLSDEHLINLRKIKRGEKIEARDIPTASIFPPETSQKYFAEMYDKLTNAQAIVAPINSSTTGIQVGYNYSDYSDFSPPNALPQLRVINGEIERKYRKPVQQNKIFPVPLDDAIGPFQRLPNI